MTPAARPAEAAGRISGLRRFSALTFCYFAAIGLFNPFAPLWFQSLGFSTVLIGFIVSLQSWTRIVAPYGWSWAGDHSGRRTELIRLAAAGALLSALALLGVQGAAGVAVVTTLLFFANSGVVPLYEALLAKLLQTDDGMDLKRYGRVRVWGSIGFLLAVLGFGALLDRYGIQMFPVAVALMNGLLLLAALRLPRTQAVVQLDEEVPAALPLLRRPEVAWLFASIFFTVLAHASLYAFLSLYLVHLGYSKAVVGIFWAISVLVEIVAFWTQGRWFGRCSPHRWLQVVAAVSAVRFAATASGGHVVAVLVLAQASHAITFGAHHAACISLVNRYFPDRLRGRGQALYTVLGYGISGVLGGVAGGWLIAALGYSAVFWAASACGLVAWWCAVKSARAEKS